MRLSDYLEMKGMSVASFAAKAGILQPTMNRYAQGKRFPSPANMHKIQKATEGKVSFEDWAHLYAPPQPKQPT